MLSCLLILKWIQIQHLELEEESQMIDRILPGMGIRSNVGVLGSCAVTMIVDDGKRVIVDVGHFGNREAMLTSLKSRGLTPSDFDIVLLTHMHWDHSLNIDLFPRARVIVDKEELERGNLTGTEDVHAQQFRKLIQSMTCEKIGDGYQITSHVKVISTPGHTVGHLSVICEDVKGRTVITGDAVPNLRAYRRGVPDLIFHDLEKAKSSVQKIKDLHSSMLIPGHDSPFNEGGYLSRDDFNLILRTEKEENLIVGVRNVTADQPQLLTSL